MPDYMFLLESRLSAEQRAAVVRVQELGAALAANVYLVGGAVRDLISGMPIRDLDFILEGNPSRFARELEKGGARILFEDERHRHVELIFAGDADGSIAAARDEVYFRPGTKPETRWSTIMEDLRRRDFSLNAIAISLNRASRGLLLDPTNGLADLEKHEVRALSIHSFTNRPVRLLRVLRYSVRMGFKIEPRTAEWFALALERGLQQSIPPEDVGRELRQLAREEKPAAILKSWETHGLIGALHPRLARCHPHYDSLQRLVRVRDEMVGAGYRPRLFVSITRAVLGRLKSREQSAALGRLGFRTAEVHAVLHLEVEAKKVVKMLSSRRTAAPRDAYSFLEKIPLDLLAFIQAEFSNAKARGKIRNFLYKWRPLRQDLASAAAELEALGLPRGPKFDKVLEDLFQQQLLGKGRTPEERTRLLRKIAGIKELPKKRAKEEKKKLAAKSVGKAGKKKPGKEFIRRAEAAKPGEAAPGKAVRGATGELVTMPTGEAVSPTSAEGATAAPPKVAHGRIPPRPQLAAPRGTEAPALTEKAKPAIAAKRAVGKRRPGRIRRANSQSGRKSKPPASAKRKPQRRKLR